MALGINSNIASINAQNQLSKSQSLSDQALERLSSGLRINSAKDDAAGLQISTKMDSQIRGMTVAQRNTNDGISMLQTAEGALDEVVNNLQRMRELAVQAGNGSNSTEQRTALKAEYDQRGEEITRIIDSTSFNDVNLLDGSAGATGEIKLQVGANSTAENQIAVTFGALDMSAALAVDISTDAAAAVAGIETIDTDLATVNTQRSTLGAKQNRLESALNTLSTSIENASASNARIMDADFAAETAKMAKSNVLQQAGISVLAQANARPNQVLSLLQ
ncbi:MAG: flagellin N-terminal helical domain-containing protein [Marinobacter sp.]